MKQELTNTLNDMIDVMESLSYSSTHINRIYFKSSQFISFLYDKNLALSSNAIKLYLEHVQLTHPVNSNYYIETKRCIKRFLYFYEHGTLIQGNFSNHMKLHGPLKEYINYFIKFLEDKYYSRRTIEDHERRIGKFDNYLLDNNIKEITADSIYNFFIHLDKTGVSQHRRYAEMISLRMFFTFIYDKNYANQNYSTFLPTVKYIRSKELPSVFTTDEIKRIIQFIDRSSAIGKRSYAIVTIATILGFRPSDICSLKFENIDWKNNKIIIIQQKTKRKAEFPLLPEVGNAILEYLKNGRKESELPYIFLSANAPLRQISSSATYSILKKYLLLANIENLDKRRHGMHSFRHSFATRMFNNNIDLPTISETLGHSDAQVTTVYLSIDYNSLKRCVIPMPKIKSDLYEDIKL